MIKILITTAAIVVAPTLAKAQDELKSVRYACEGNTILDVTFINTAAGNSYAVLADVVDGNITGMVPLKAAVTASGARYESMNPDYTYRLDTKRDEAILSSVDGNEATVLRSCSSN